MAIWLKSEFLHHLLTPANYLRHWRVGFDPMLRHLLDSRLLKALSRLYGGICIMRFVFTMWEKHKQKLTVTGLEPATLSHTNSIK